MNVLRLHRLVAHVVDLAPALVDADEVGLHGDGGRALRRNHVRDVVAHLVAELGRQLARGGIDLHHFVRRAVLEVRIRLPRSAEQRRLADDVLVGVEHDELRARLARLEIPGHLARALVRSRRAAIRGRRD